MKIPRAMSAPSTTDRSSAPGFPPFSMNAISDCSSSGPTNTTVSLMNFQKAVWMNIPRYTSENAWNSEGLSGFFAFWWFHDTISALPVFSEVSPLSNGGRSVAPICVSLPMTSSGVSHPKVTYPHHVASASPLLRVFTPSAPFSVKVPASSRISPYAVAAPPSPSPAGFSVSPSHTSATVKQNDATSDSERVPDVCPPSGPMVAWSTAIRKRKSRRNMCPIQNILM
mmetsp:Transcript_45363/g.108212  ORF Transcript_45363/g.108212 Transcript_45363/m.108212 type:complete len:226 (+) Transcript_45363:3697-4374(+)